jgi:ankyrin repeat protein
MPRATHLCSVLLVMIAGTTLVSTRASQQMSRSSQRGTSALENSARRTWESGPDWGRFTSPVVGDAAVKDELKALLDSGVSPNAQDKQGRMALHVAAMLGQTELARYLLSRGAGVDARDRLGRTPLMVSASLGGFKLFAGTSSPWPSFWADPLCPEREGDDSSNQRRKELREWYIIAPAHPPLVRLLIEAGADVNAADSEGQTVMDHAGMGGPTEIDRLILASGRVRGGRQCELKLAQAPALCGFRLGMTLSEASSRFSYYGVPAADSCGRVNITLDPQPGRLWREARRPEEFDGVRGVRLGFLDGRLTYVRMTYDNGTSWRGVSEYLAALSGSLGLPASWHKAGDGGVMSQAHVIGCDGFKMVAGIDLGAYVELHDVAAVQEMLRRKVEDDTRRKREDERERERRRRVFRP